MIKYHAKLTSNNQQGEDKEQGNKQKNTYQF